MGLHCLLFKIIIVGFYFKSSIRMSNSSGLILVQTVCKGYQQTSLVNKELKQAWFSERCILSVNERNTQIVA